MPVTWSGDRKGPTVDHVVPVARGGTNAPANLITMCRSCNSSKGATLPEELQHRLRQRIERALRKPIDPAVGRELCERYCPGWLARKSGRSRKRRGPVEISFP